MKSKLDLQPAAFGRLCVETTLLDVCDDVAAPAAFGRLCVETTALDAASCFLFNQPPSGGCVLKPNLPHQAAQTA